MSLEKFEQQYQGTFPEISETQRMIEGAEKNAIFITPCRNISSVEHLARSLGKPGIKVYSFNHFFGPQKIYENYVGRREIRVDPDCDYSNYHIMIRDNYAEFLAFCRAQKMGVKTDKTIENKIIPNPNFRRRKNV